MDTPSSTLICPPHIAWVKVGKYHGEVGRVHKVSYQGGTQLCFKNHALMAHF
jgi:hypothetical protein